MKTVLTFDVEAHRGMNPVESFIWGKALDGNEYGLKLIIETLNQYNLKCIFFVDFAEVYDYGFKKIEQVVKYIMNNGHDVGLHLHPDHFGDKERTFLWEYTYEEQLDMISKCKEIYSRMTGTEPLCFRAGKFGANDDTIRVLETLQISYDFSCLYNHSWCEVSKRLKTNKYYKLNDEVTEIPVSVFSSAKLGYRAYRYDQFDFGDHPIEFDHVIKSQNAIDDSVILTAFFHSFSFFPYRNDPERLKFNAEMFNRFKTNLDRLKSEDVEVVSGIEGLVQAIEDDPVVVEELPDSGSIVMQLFFLVDRSRFIFQSNRKARMLLLALASILILLLYLTIKYIQS